MKEQEIASPVKWQIDPLDAEPKRFESKFLGSFAAAMGAWMILPPMLNFGFHENAIAVLGTTVNLSVRTGIEFYWNEKKIALEKRGLFEDKELGGQAFKFVYQGSPLPGRLERGDNFYYIRMGKPSVPEAAVIDAFDCWLNEAREIMAKHEYNAVAMEMPEMIGYELVPKGRLFGGKKWDIVDARKPVTLLTREQFEDFSFSPQAAFVKGCQALGNKRVEEYLRLGSRDLLAREFIEEIERQVNAQNAASSLIFQRDEKYAPRRQRVHEIAFIREKEGELFAEILKNGTSIEFVPLSRLINSKAGSRLKQAYELYLILQKTPIEELTRERVLERDEVLDRMRSAGVTIELPSGGYKSFWRKSEITSGKEAAILALSVPLYLAFRLAQPVLTTLAIYLSAHPVMAVAKNLFTFDRLTTNPVASRETDYEPISFPLDIPPYRLDWKVEVKGDINPDGYYTERTSSWLENSSWIINKDAKERLLLPPYFDETIPHIALSKRIGLNLNGKSTFRIPVKNGTNLAALRLTDREGSIVPAETWKLTDGTVEVELQRNLLEGGPSWIDATAYLTISENEQIKASGKIPSLDPEKIDPYLLNRLREFEAYTANRVITEFVRDSHLYSLDPPGESLLRRVNSPEDLVNVIDLLPGCSCEICNSESVLLSTIDGDDPLSMAFGYLHGNFNPAANGTSFLLAEAYHAYGIDAKGEIFDATPAKPAADPLTKKYFEARESIRGNSSDPQDSEWAALRQEIAQKSQTPEDFIHNVKLLVIFLTSMAALSLIKPSINLAKAAASRNNLLCLGDKVAEKLFSRKDLGLAYNFFSWLSWATDELPLGSCQVKSSGILSLIRSGVDSESLSDYLTVPQHLEDKAGLSPIERAKMRVLARYLLL